MKEIFYFSNNLLNNVVENKFQAKNIYGSYLIRYVLKSNNLIRVVDDSSMLLHLFIKRYSILYSNKLLKVGSSIVGRKILFTNSIDNSTKLQHFFPGIYRSNSIFNFLKTLVNFEKFLPKKNIENFFIPCKGGYLFYSLGLFGFCKQTNLAIFSINKKVTF